MSEFDLKYSKNIDCIEEITKQTLIGPRPSLSHLLFGHIYLKIKKEKKSFLIQAEGPLHIFL